MTPGGYAVPLGFTALMNPNLPRVSFKTVNKIYLLLIFFL